MTLACEATTANAGSDPRNFRQDFSKSIAASHSWSNRPQWLAALAAVDEFENEDPVGTARTWGLVPARHLFKLFIYAYLEGILSSADIADLVASDPCFRMLCEERAIKVELLRRFRRTHRSRLEEMLALAIAIQEEGGESACLRRDKSVLYKARAKSVIAHAVFWDTMDSDY